MILMVKKCLKSFSKKKYGEEKAIEMAIQLRKQMEKRKRISVKTFRDYRKAYIII